jgi:hypothetical protein
MFTAANVPLPHDFIHNFELRKRVIFIETCNTKNTDVKSNWKKQGKTYDSFKCDVMSQLTQSAHAETSISVARGKF